MLAAALAGCGGERAEQSPEGPGAQAVSFEGQSQQNSVLEPYNEAIEQAPENAELYVARSIIYLQSPATYDLAISDATRAIALDPSLPESYVNRASALLDMGHLEYSRVSADTGKTLVRTSADWALGPDARISRVIADTTRAIELDPDQAHAYFARGHALMDAGRQYDRAVSDFSRALELAPNTYLKIMAYVHRSQAHRDDGNLDLAIQDATAAADMEEDLTKAFSREPRLITWHGFGVDSIIATAYTNRGLAYDQQGRLGDAIAEYVAAIQRDTNYMEAYVNRARAYVNMGRYETALADATKALTLAPNLAAAFDIRSLAYLGLGQDNQALVDSSRAIAADPGYAVAYSNRAYINTGLGKYGQAVVDATRAIEIDPDLASAYANRAEAAFLAGNHEGAIADSTAALAIDSNLILTLVGRAMAYLATGSYPEALDDARLALSMNPAQLEALLVRGMALLASTDGRQGREDLDRIIQSSQNASMVRIAQRALSEASP
jgi:tetratricopeptide (TPR) repeat protein